MPILIVLVSSNLRKSPNLNLNFAIDMLVWSTYALIFLTLSKYWKA